MIVDALVDQDPSLRVEREDLATYAALSDAGAHGTLLQERGGKTALLERGERADGIIAEDDDRVGEVDLESGGFEGEDAGQGLAADLVAHVLRVGEGADDHLAGDVGPPAQHHAPTVERGVPRDDDDVGGVGLAS